jgi:uroporphyrinogen decarboxylase
MKRFAEKIEGGEGRDYPVIQGVAGGFLHMRNLFGLKGLFATMCKDPDLVHEIMENWLNINKFVLERELELVDLDAVWIAEDICYKNGLFISPKSYREFLSPYYKELTVFLKSYNVKVVYDSDGNLKQLIPLLIEWGCDGIEPFEVQAGNDIGEVRKQYGESLVIIGGIDKRVLAQDFNAIDREVKRVLSFFTDKHGYIPMIDHTIPPNVPLKNYMYYLEVLRKTE